MANILIGIVSGLVSGMGMGGRDNLNLVLIPIYGYRSTHSPRSKPCIFCSNVNSLNNYKHKTKINQMENSTNSRTDVE